ncbi:putative SAM-dependent methyltransferase [Tamaricihabitans halophyticus]|uniref:Putative SAM-dependent methyltransferase n=1 Tax=Tamaricihabitans halophyticus TaxID=1262583 RepID=A0A4R2R398_9PSEU|nr:methyltransferase domain-containing protein [Tamaricihabitans halophyticus]TCP56497.1 putative SAM-dependent methyltransferase [Tamaricihabitans halophyticus]
MAERPTIARRADEQLANYLRFITEQQHAQKRTKSTDSALRRLAKHAVPVQFRGKARFLVTDALTPLARARARQLLREHATGEDFLLHIGSGGEHKEGWVNLDLAGDPVELPWNLKRGLPFPDATVDAIFSEHLLEHIPLPGVAQTLAECHRVLKPGGTMRVGVPDAGQLLESYARGGTGFIEHTRPDRPTSMLAVQELFYWYGHCTMFDEETLGWLLAAAGFTEPVKRCEPLETRLPVPAPDTERRWAETLYMETIRPT